MKPATVSEPRSYYVAVDYDAPFNEVTLGGINFQKIVQTPTQEGLINPRRGMIVRLTEQQAQAVRKAIDNRVVRFTGRAGSRMAQIYHKELSIYTPQPDDQPLAEYVIFRPASDKASILPAETIPYADPGYDPTADDAIVPWGDSQSKKRERN